MGNGRGVVDAADRASFQAWLVKKSGGGVFFGARCNVIDPAFLGP